MLKFINKICIIFVLCCSFVLQSFADLTIKQTTDKTFIVPSEELCVTIKFNSENALNVSTFRLIVKFDSSKVMYKGLFSRFGSGDFKTNVSDDELTLIYLTNEKGIDIPANESVDILELNFKVLSTVDDGDLKIQSEIDGIGNFNAKEIPSPDINDISVTTASEIKTDCDLQYLEAIDSTLNPKFSSDITKYSVNVPYYKNTIDFKATASDPSATVKVSRRTLNAQGKTTDINITVISNDKKSKKVYTVTVNRGMKNSVSSTSAKSSSYKSSSLADKTSPSSEEYLLTSADENDLLVKPNNTANNSGNLIVKEGGGSVLIILSIVAIFIFAAYFIWKSSKKE